MTHAFKDGLVRGCWRKITQFSWWPQFLHGGSKWKHCWGSVSVTLFLC